MGADSRAMPPTFFCWKDPTCPSLDWYQRAVPDWVRISLILPASAPPPSVPLSLKMQVNPEWKCGTASPVGRQPRSLRLFRTDALVRTWSLSEASSMNLILLRSLCCAQRINNGSQSDSFPESCCHPSVGTTPPRLSQLSLNSAY